MGGDVYCGAGHDAHHSERARGEAEVIIWAVGVASLVFAGVLYLTFREVPRRLFFYFIVADLTLLIGLRAMLRAMLRFTGRGASATSR